MRFLYGFLILFCLFACNKIELPDENAKPDKEENNDQESEKHPDQPGQEDATYCSIAEAQLDNPEKPILVKGYIVGYIAGTSMKTASIFALPAEKANTNFLLADSPEEKNYQKCIAVKLEKDGKEATRSELNLFDHPELFHKLIKIDGYLNKYFSQNGITKIFSYEINENEEGTPDDNKTEGDSSRDSIGIDLNEDLILEGRNIRNFKKSVQSFW